MTGQKQEEQKIENEDDFEASFKIPETKGLLKQLQEASLNTLQQEHEALRQEQGDKDKDKDKDKDSKKRQRPRNSTICCCQVEGCSIGPFMERQGLGGEDCEARP